MTASEQQAFAAFVLVIVSWTDEGLTYEGISRVMGLEGDVVSCPAGASGRCEAVLDDGEPVTDPYRSACRARRHGRGLPTVIWSTRPRVIRPGRRRIPQEAERG